MYQMPPIKFGRHTDQKIKFAQGICSISCIRCSGKEIPTHTEHKFYFFFMHRFNGAHYIITMLSRHLKSVEILNSIQLFIGRLFIDQHRPIPLYIAMSAYRTNSSSENTDTSFQQQDIQDFTNHVYTIKLLGHPHSPADNNSFLESNHCCSFIDQILVNSSFFS